METKKARLIYNPLAGRELMKAQVPDILDRLEDAGYEASAHATKGPDSARAEACRVANAGFDLVVSAGGDGTLFEVVNGLSCVEKRPTLGILPAGTSNDFASALGIPDDLKQAASVLTNGKRVPVDVGRAGDAYFINIAAAGYLTEVTYDTPIKLKNMLGQLAYYVKGIEKLQDITPVRAKITYDGKVFDEEIMIFMLANSSRVGGFEQLAPRASFSDGLFDLLIARKMNIAELLQLGSLLLRGEHLSHPRVLYVQAREVTVEVDHPLRMNLDGEYGGDLATRFVNLRHHLDVLVPASDGDEQEEHDEHDEN